MAYVDTPASRTASFQAGVDDAVVVRGVRTFTPRGEIAPGVDGLGLAPASSSGSGSSFDWGSLISGVIKGGADLLGAKMAAKDAAKAAGRQEDMARDEANRQAALAREQMASQERIAAAKAKNSFINKVPGGWVTLGVGGAVVLGLVLFLAMRRRGP